MFLASLAHLHLLYAQINLALLPLLRRGPRRPRSSGMAARGWGGRVSGRPGLGYARCRLQGGGGRGWLGRVGPLRHPEQKP